MPDLVRAWPAPADVTSDPFSVKLTLRTASWSDGTQITSSDVRYSADKLRQGGTGYRYRYLKSVDVITARTFRLRFDRPLRRWWALFSLDDMILPAHAYSSAWKDGPTVSGGPFAFGRWTKGHDITLVRNDRYFGEKAKLKELDVDFVPDDETRLQLLGSHELDAFVSEGDSNMGRRAKAHGFPTTSKALDGGGGASGVWGPTWLELDLDAARLSDALRQALIEGTGPSLAAEILEDSGRRLDAIPPNFDAISGVKLATVRPWHERGSLTRVHTLLGGTTRTFKLAFSHGPAGAIAAFMHFRLDPEITVELAGVEPSALERTWIPNKQAPAFLRVRRGADAPDAEAYSSLSKLPGAGPVDDDVVSAETRGASATVRTGLDDTSWAAVEAGLRKAATVAPIVQLRTWIVGRPGVSGPEPMGTSEGPFAGSATWRVENG